jgi:hypothetical protein
MTDLELVPERERHRVADLSTDRYDGILRGALAANERVLLATSGAIALNFNQRSNPLWTTGILVLTNERILLLQARKKSITGKLKDRPLVELDLANVFGTGDHRIITGGVVVEYNANRRFEGHMVKVREPDRHAPPAPADAYPNTDYAAIWRVTIFDAAEVKGGTRNLPPGIER